MSVDITCQSLEVTVPDDIAPTREQAIARALIFAQFATHMGQPAVDGVDRVVEGWSVRLRESSAATATARRSKRS